MSEIKKVSATDVYKEHLQAIIYQELGTKVSKDKAWKLFKAIILGTVQHVAKIDGGKLSLAGIGTFQVQKTKARGSKAEAGWPFVPRFKFRASSVVAASVEKMFGLGGHDDLEVKDYGIYASAPVVEEVAEEVVEEVVAAPVEEAPAAPVDDFFNI